MPQSTHYRVYRSDEAGNTLAFVGEADGVNDKRAIKTLVGDAPAHTHYVAIPARNFHVRAATVQSQPKVVIS